MHSKFGSVLVMSGIVAMAVGCGTTGNPKTATTSSQQNRWLTYNTSDKVATIKLDANYNNTDGGMNFNGYSNGAMQITVPQGWKVKVSFKNDNLSLAHSAMFVPYEQRTNTNFFASNVSFSGATTPDASFGTTGNVTQIFSFTADKIGKYAIVCGVAGHAAMGMWDTFVVSGSSGAPSITTK